MLNDNFRSAIISVLNSVPWLGKKLKHSRELEYWKFRKEAEGALNNNLYEYYFTKHFDIEREFYRDKRILDVGCGPRGSLEWADLAIERVGLDPLVPSYRTLGIDKHAMSYCAAPSEAIPFNDSHFDVVSCINALDHVDNVPCTVREIMRVIKPGGLLLLIVEVNHRVRICEPHNLDPGLVESFAPAFAPAKGALFGSGPCFESLRDAVPYPGIGPGWLSVILTKDGRE